jgi:hypothetical protein
MSQIVTKFIQDNAVTDAKIRLTNNGWLRARNQANSADLNVLELDSSNTIQFGSVPQTPSSPVATNDVPNKNYVDQVVSNLIDKAKTEYFTLSGGDIANGYITLSNPAFFDSVYVEAGGVGQYLNQDYSLSTPVTNTQINFLSPLSAILSSGDELSVSYNVATSVSSGGPVIVNLLKEVAIINETESSGTSGGTFTAGAWQTRVLNTVQSSQPWLSLASNQFTLAAGTYDIEALAPGFYVNGHQARIQNITDSTTAITGSSEYSGETGGSATNSDSVCKGTITIAGQKTFELQHQCSTTHAGNGFGVGNGYGNEVFSQIEISRLRNSSSIVYSNSTGSSTAISVNTPGAILDSTSNPLQVPNFICDGTDIEIGLQDDGSGGAGALDYVNVPTTNAWPQVYVQFYEDGTLISNQRALTGANTNYNHGAVPPSSFKYIRTPAAGVHTYTVQAMVLDADGGTPSGTAQNLVMYVRAK